MEDADANTTTLDDETLFKEIAALMQTLSASEATVQIVRPALEEKLKLNLSRRSKFISSSIKRVLREVQAEALQGLTEELVEDAPRERQTRQTKQKSKQPTKGKKSAPQKIYKSAEFISDDEDDAETTNVSQHSAKHAPQTSVTSKAKRPKTSESTSTGLQKELTLSSQLAEFLGAPKMTRPQVVKRIWDYIKEHNLQKPTDKRVILNDERLQKVVKSATMTMFSMNKLLSKHFLED